MSDQSLAPTTSPTRNGQSHLSPHRMVLMVMWLATSVALIVMLANGVRDTDQYQTLRYLFQTAYVAALLWFLIREGPAIHRLPELQPIVYPRRKCGPWIPAVVLTIMLLLILISDEGLGLLLLLLMVSPFWMLVVWRREIRWRQVWQGLALAIIAFLAGLPAMKNGLVGTTTFYGLLVLFMPMYVAGGLLINRTSLGGIQLVTGRYLKALQSFLWGCLAFVPLGLINAAEGSPGTDINWVTEWWMPFSLPWYSGMAEEVLFRLLLVGLCYFLLRPVFRKYPALAVLAAVVFSAIAFGLGHGRTVERLLTTGLLYGLSMAVVFARRDWEHAAGAHYMVNMIPWVMVFLAN